LPLEAVIKSIIEGMRIDEEKYKKKANLGAGPAFRWRERDRVAPNKVLESSSKHRQKIAYLKLSAESKEYDLQ